MTKKFFAKVLGYGQLAVTWGFQAIQGQPIPSTKAGWSALLTSVFVAIGTHLASETSAGHPNGKVSQ